MSFFKLSNLQIMFFYSSFFYNVIFFKDLKPELRLVMKVAIFSGLL